MAVTDALLGGTPDAPQRYAAADPARLPHGRQDGAGARDGDEQVPMRSARLPGRARAAGDQVTVHELDKVDHMSSSTRVGCLAHGSRGDREALP